ncbi:MAG: hypothetical protein R6U85_03490, partial [Salinivirgaceae bacterium]
MLRKILFNNIPATYTIGAVFGVLIGFLLLMLTLNAWNLYTAFTGSTQGQSEQFVTINKKVGLLNSLNSSFSSFKEAEIDDLSQQPFIDDWAPYLRSTFAVQASRQASANMPYMRTEMFFEALPSRFLDHKPKEFTWEKGQSHIPIIIPKEYLNLYNFGFAKAQAGPHRHRGQPDRPGHDDLGRAEHRGRGLRTARLRTGARGQPDRSRTADSPSSSRPAPARAAAAARSGTGSPPPRPGAGRGSS